MKEITEKRLRELEDAEKKLTALEANGVDNWSGYDFAMEEVNKQRAREDKIESALSDIADVILLDAYEPSGRGAGYGTSDKALEKALEILNKLISTLCL